MSKIHVTGRGSIYVVPDVTRIEISIKSVFETYNDAYTKAKSDTNQMVKILEYNHLPGKLCKTTRMDICEHSVSDYSKTGSYMGSHIEGYELHLSMKVDIGIDPKMTNNLVKGVGKFIDNAQINIGYTIQDPRPTQLKMLERAVKDAHDKAEIMAKAAGCTLGDVTEINYGKQELHVYSEARNIHSNEEAKASTAESLDITPEDLVFSDDVQVEWELIKKEA